MAESMFEAWCREVDTLCREHVACGWDDLCGDVEPLERGFDAGESPRAFVEWLARKYDLTWVERPLTGSRQ